MNPLIIRPQPAADDLAQRLRADGHHPVICPLLSYSPGNDLPELISLLPEANIIIAVSNMTLSGVECVCNTIIGSSKRRVSR